MVWLRRVELWVLLAVVVAGLIFAFAWRDRETDEAGGAGTSAAASAESAPVMLHRCVLEREADHARLEVEVRVRNSRPETLVLQPPRARLLAAAGREVPPFFLPFDPQPEIPANATQDVQLSYWLDAPDLQHELRLEVDGTSLAVKSSRPFDLGSLKNLEKRAIEPGGW